MLDKPGVGENLQDHLQLRDDLQGQPASKTLNEMYGSLFGARADVRSTMRCAAAAR